jgi:hypothetical protein
MTTYVTPTDGTPDADERVAAFAAELHRLADLIAEGAVPVPFLGGGFRVSWYVRGDDRHEKVEGYARALAPEWRADQFGSSGYLSAVATVAGIEYDLNLAEPPAAPPVEPSAAFAAKLTAAVERHRELAEGDR